jgi:hypothetical protein
MRLRQIVVRIGLSGLAAVGFGWGLSVIGCGAAAVPLAGPDTSGSTPLAEGEARAFDFTDNYSGVIGGIEFWTGLEAWVFGEKDGVDSVTAVDAIAILTPDDELIEIHFDEFGRPTRIVHGDDVWDITYDSDDISAMQTATVTKNGETATITLSDEFLEAMQIIENGGLDAETTGKGPNRQTFFGAVSMFAGGVGLFALGTAGSPLVVGGILVGSMVNVAGGGLTIAQSLSDRPPTKIEQWLGDKLNWASLILGSPGMASTNIKLVDGVAVTTLEAVDNLGTLATTASMQESELAAEAEAAEEQACSYSQYCTSDLWTDYDSWPIPHVSPDADTYVFKGTAGVPLTISVLLQGGTPPYEVVFYATEGRESWNGPIQEQISSSIPTSSTATVTNTWNSAGTYELMVVFNHSESCMNGLYVQDRCAWHVDYTVEIGAGTD